MINTPGCFCIGAQKAGTTWLYQMLRRHPDVWGGPFKEVQYFNSLFVKEHCKWTNWHIRQSVERAVIYHVKNEPKPNLEYLNYLTRLADRQLMFKEEWYSHFFGRGKDKLQIDVTPEYSSIPPEGIDYFLRIAGAVPVIYLIRDPVSRSMSQLRMNLSRTNQAMPRSREQWIELANDWDIDDRGNYQRNIRNWLSRYPNDQLLFLPYGRVAKDPNGLLREVEDFVGLSHHNYTHANETVFEGKKIEVPDYLKDVLREKYDHQYKFLLQELGAEFLAQT